MPNHLALLLYVQIHAVLDATIESALDPGRQRLAPRDERGQATTEYALVLLAAALVGLMVVAWATAGGGAARISRLFNSVIDAVIDRV
jgi:Flp pilus assembly pilin Flp